ncbi:nucleoporin [Gigaspora margarita]|uniref:Nucleoporin n=1 Tax=Gigaspora margarita TaxID=4874 RepID=A0A8H3WVY5_GIGMA|nr:nucleoporin [Gigaspora margarita]
MTEEIEAQSFEEEDVEFFEFKQFNKNALSVQLLADTVYPEVIPPYPSLLAISNTYGYFVAATNEGFIYASTQALHELFENSEAGSKELLSDKIHFEISEGKVRCLRLSSDQLTLIVVVEGGLVLFYDVTKFASEKAGCQPFQIMSFPDDIKDLRPNPGEKYNLIAILLVSGIVYIKDYLLNNEISKIEGSKVGERFAAICWSQKGKQIICGNHLGQLMQYTPEGTHKSTIQPPQELQQHYVQNVLWLESALFVVAYFPVIQEEDSEHVVFIISRETKSKILYIKCPTICSPIPSDHLKPPYLYMETIKDWGSNLKSLIICASANSTDINLIARDESNNWASLILSETNRAALPLSEPTEADSKTPHMIRMNATNNEINELHNLIEELENSYIVKYHDRTTEQRFDNPDSWLIGDLPVITSEINRLEHEASSMSQALADLRRQVNEFSHDVHIDYVKTTKDIEHLMYTPSTITVGRRGILQSRIKERLETTFKTVKESAQALEAQLNALHEQIQEKKSNKSLRQSPLEYIDRSIRNITEATAAYLNKERICERLKTINKFNRKSPVKTGVFEENEDDIEKKFISPIIISSKKSQSIPPAFATPPNNVSALSSLPATPSQAFGQSAFGQSSFGAANLQGFGQPAFGQPAFGQPAFGQPAFGQPAFGQHGFGQARPFGTPAVLSTAMKPQSGSGFARFASNNAFGSVNNGNNILGAGGNNFGGANASVNTTKSSFTEFRG